MIERLLSRGSAAAVVVAGALLGMAQPAQAIPLLNGFGGPSGYGLPEHCVHPNDDGSYAGPTATTFGTPVAIDLRPAFPGGLRFFSAMPYNTFYLNTNGNITFRGAVSTYTPSPFPIADQPMIAPWWGDVDTRGLGMPTRNNICYHIEANRIVLTWNMVGYFASHNDRLNDFQMILSTSGTCTTGGDFDVEFRYNQCQWTTGDASGGMGGLGGTPAQVGFDAGDRRNFVSLPMSRTMAILDVCRSSNVPGGAPGLWRFQIRGGILTGGCTGAGTPCTIAGQMGACGQGVNVCSGMGVTCSQVNRPTPERCNGNDDDCNGMVDEGDMLCPGSQVCDRGSCVERCMPELGCLPGQTCSDRGSCVETACLMVSCPVGQRCSGGACVGVCDGINCPHGQLCRVGRCVDPCAGITCDARQVCQNGMCVPGCQCTPCRDGQTCQPDGYCIDDPCIGVTCPTGTYCANGMCRDSCETGPDTRLCPPGEVCRTGECTPGVDRPNRDAGVADGSAGDAGRADAGRDAGRNDVVAADVRGDARVDSGSSTGVVFQSTPRGCSCRAGAEPTGGRWLALGILAGVVGLRRRRARR